MRCTRTVKDDIQSLYDSTIRSQAAPNGKRRVTSNALTDEIKYGWRDDATEMRAGPIEAHTATHQRRLPAHRWEPAASKGKRAVLSYSREAYFFAL